MLGSVTGHVCAAGGHSLHGVIPAGLQPAFPAPVRGAAVRPKLRELLGVDALPNTAGEVTASWREAGRSDGPDADGVSWVRGSFVNSLGGLVPTVLLLPPSAAGAGAARGSWPGLVCVPDTSGSAERISDLRLTDDIGPVTGAPPFVLVGWARELARRGFACACVTIFGCTARHGHTAGLWDQQTKFLNSYGRPPMVRVSGSSIRQICILPSLSCLLTRFTEADLQNTLHVVTLVRMHQGVIADETIRAAYLLGGGGVLPGVDAARIGVTGMSLGGLAAVRAVRHQIP